MNKRLKLIIGLTLVLMLVFGFVVIRTFVAKPQDTVKVVPIPAGEYDPAVWGKAYPLQYASYQKNRLMSPSPTGYGGSEKVQKSIMQPEILTNFKGNPFSKDYTEDRGHPYAVEDLLETKRIGPTSPGACITCKTAHVETFFKDMGWGYAKVPLMELTAKTKHPVVCGNCHDPATMDLRVINPAFIEAMSRRGIDVKKAPREDMRSYVCGQCHAEYYFEPGSNRVVFPWDKGLTPEAMYDYYTTKPLGFVQDWVHPDSKAPMLKAQHPEFETWSQGTHGKAGVSCADCHMPFTRENGRKYTSHWVTSPLKSIKTSCRTCHTQSEEWLLTQVKTTQDRTWQLMHIAGLTIARAHEATGKAGENPAADPAALAKSRELIRKAQWFWDIVAAENGMGVHNPGGNMNILGQAIDLAHQAIETANQANSTTKQ
jgi:nitrite reductase (cytochrome c-552)